MQRTRPPQPQPQTQSAPAHVVLGGGDVAGTDPAPQLIRLSFFIIFTTPAGAPPGPARAFPPVQYRVCGTWPAAPRVAGLLHDTNKSRQ